MKKKSMKELASLGTLFGTKLLPCKNGAVLFDNVQI
jgi:hypothetical protein